MLSVCGEEPPWLPVGDFYITSPAYPADYDSNLLCNMTLVKQANIGFHLAVLDFDLESRLTECYDWLSVSELGPNAHSRTFTYCGENAFSAKAPDEQNFEDVLLQFSTDSENARRGFLIKVKSEYIVCMEQFILPKIHTVRLFIMF